jgi:acid phosphatase (class A)
LPRFPPNWDPDLRTYIYLNDFVQVNYDSGAHRGWFEILDDPLVIGNEPKDDDLDPQILEILNAAPDREDRFAEIIDQNDADGAIAYYLGMLMIDPGRHPNTYLLIRVARRIGELVTMALKGKHMHPRPSQLCPAIVPMIDPPMTPSFPAGHALQSRLISLALEDARPGQRQKELLDYLARRIGENRVIAGIHFNRDIDAGVDVATKCYSLMQNSPIFNQLIVDARNEI